MEGDQLFRVLLCLDSGHCEEVRRGNPQRFSMDSFAVGADLRVCPNTTINVVSDERGNSDGRVNLGEHIGSPLQCLFFNFNH